MSDTATTTDTPETPEGLRAAKAATDQRNADLAAENAKLRKESLFARASIDHTKGVGQLLFNQFDGDKLEDLIEQASELGLIKDPDEQAAETTTAIQQNQQQMGDIFRGGASGGGTTDTGKGPDPKQGMIDDFTAAKLAGDPDEMARLKALGNYFTKAVKDPRTRFDKNQHFQIGQEADTAMVGRQ